MTLLIIVCFHMGSPRCTVALLAWEQPDYSYQKFLCELKMQFGLRPGVELTKCLAYNITWSWAWVMLELTHIQ